MSLPQSWCVFGKLQWQLVAKVGSLAVVSTTLLIILVILLISVVTASSSTRRFWEWLDEKVIAPVPYLGWKMTFRREEGEDIAGATNVCFDCRKVWESSGILQSLGQINLRTMQSQVSFVEKNIQHTRS